MCGWEVLRSEFLVPGVFHGRGRPLRRRTAGLGLLAKLIKALGTVDNPLCLFDRRPLEMQFVLLLLWFMVFFQVTVGRTL